MGAAKTSRLGLYRLNTRPSMVGSAPFVSVRGGAGVRRSGGTRERRIVND